MWTIFKVFIECVTILLLFFVLVFWPQGMEDLSSPRRDWTCSLCIRRGSLNHGTTREVPKLCKDQMRTEFVQSMRCPLSPSPVFHPCVGLSSARHLSVSQIELNDTGDIDSNVSAARKWGKVRPSLCDFKVRDCHCRFHSSSYKHRQRGVHSECPVGTERRKTARGIRRGFRRWATWFGFFIPSVSAPFIQCSSSGARGLPPSLGMQEGIKLDVQLAPLMLSCRHKEPVAPPACWFFLIH